MKIAQLIPAAGPWVLRKQRPNTSGIDYQIACWALCEDGKIYPMIVDEGLPRCVPDDWEYFCFRHSY